MVCRDKFCISLAWEGDSYMKYIASDVLAWDNTGCPTNCNTYQASGSPRKLVYSQVNCMAYCSQHSTGGGGGGGGGKLPRSCHWIKRPYLHQNKWSMNCKIS